jgi:hypothetical protein
MLLRISFLVLAATAAPARADDLVLVKPSIVVTTYNHEGFYKAPKVRDDLVNSWTPRIEFDVAGPVEAGSRIVVDFAMGGKPWVSLELQPSELKAGQTQHLEAGAGSDVPVEKAITGTGELAFKIHVKNELAGSDKPVFAGKAAVKKYLPQHLVGNTKYKNAFQFYVDQDFRLAMAELAWSTKQGPEAPYLTVRLWMRGHVVESKDLAYIFQDGKQYCSTSSATGGSITTTEWISGTSDEAPTWTRANVHFNCTRAFDKHGEGSRLPEDTFHMVDKHPGAYEVKILRGGKLSRTLAFTIDGDGHIVDTGLAAKNALGTSSIVVPIKLVASEDGNAKTFDRTAWKSGLYGNPIAGLAP